eukprot:s3472_g4.t1
MCPTSFLISYYVKNSQTQENAQAPFYLPTGECAYVPISQFPGPGPDGTKTDCLKSRSAIEDLEAKSRSSLPKPQEQTTICRLPRLDHLIVT